MKRLIAFAAMLLAISLQAKKQEPWQDPNIFQENRLPMRATFVADQYHLGYVRTQESGTHTGLRFFRVLDASGNGLEAASVTDFSASALPYSIADLDVSAPEGDVLETNANGQRGVPRHSLELVPSGLTHVHIDAIQMGVGSVDSWGSVPLEQYHVKPVAREFRFVLSPVVN